MLVEFRKVKVSKIPRHLNTNCNKPSLTPNRKSLLFVISSTLIKTKTFWTTSFKTSFIFWRNSTQRKFELNKPKINSNTVFFYHCFKKNAVVYIFFPIFYMQKSSYHLTFDGPLFKEAFQQSLCKLKHYILYWFYRSFND